MQIILSCCINTDFKKVQQPLQWKHFPKIEFCIWLSVLGLFHVGQVIQNDQSVL